MKEYVIKATIETRVSQKGNEYTVLVLKLTPTYTKSVFLDKAEIELLNNSNNSSR